MKKKIALVVVIISLIAMGISGTMAYFTADSTATNVITAGNIDITLEEWQVEDKIPYPEEKIEGVMPGESIDKIVKVYNNGDNPAYVRILLTKTIALSGNSGEEVDPSLISCDINTADWEQIGDYYYYKHQLEPGKTTSPLFTEVSFSEKMGNKYQNCKATIDVNAQAVQVKNNGTTVLEAAGWPEE